MLDGLRGIIDHVHGKHPKAPIFTIGTSIGANVLVKYLGEEGDSTPVGAAAAVCNPWDLLISYKYTVDTYYRRAISADFLTKVAVPLLCFSVMDDPVCTREAIPWDEIFAKSNVVMVTTKHVGHLALFEGFTARTHWWTRALMEFMTLIIPSHLIRNDKKI